MRYAVYFTPRPETPLCRFGASILGYDAYTGSRVSRAGVDEGIEALTAEPRRYGFHATLKPPFRLRHGRSARELTEQVRRLAASQPVIPIGKLAPALIRSFIALVPAAPSRKFDLLAAECVAAFDYFRAPPEQGDRERRRVDLLTRRQAALFERWGYPYVFEEFRFHMTLTGSIPSGDQATWLQRLSAEYETLVNEEVLVDGLTLLSQEPGAAFRVIERFPCTPG